MFARQMGIDAKILKWEVKGSTLLSVRLKKERARLQIMSEWQASVRSRKNFWFTIKVGCRKDWGQWMNSSFRPEKKENRFIILQATWGWEVARELYEAGDSKP